MGSKMRLLSGHLPRVAVCYNGGFKSLTATVQRGFSQDSPSRSGPTVVFEARRDQSEYPEPELFTKSIDDKFGEQFRHFPMPGNVTTTHHYLRMKERSAIAVPKTASGLDQSDVMNTTTTHDRQIGTLHNFSEASRKLPPRDLGIFSVPSTLECAAQPCPELARKHFADLFPGRDMQKGTLTVMTLAQRTQNDMSEWTDEVDRERDEMMSQFISTASAICETLQREGYWADFIDPTSGRPYLGPFTNSTMFDSDERYRNFGFSIEDLGCCKVIRHPVWGTHAFVGSIFSDAPLDSPILQKLLPQQRNVSEPSSVMTAEELLGTPSSLASGSADQDHDKANAEPAPLRRKTEKTSEVRVLKRDDKC